jgi:heterodisulfide reductase subunit C2
MTKPLTWDGMTLVEEVAQRSGTTPSACFQCHKCSTGCPIGPDMDLLPSQVMRMVHLGMAEQVLQSRSIWLCASCEACTTRCPQQVDIAAVMDALRIMAVDRKVEVPDGSGQKFNDSFLRSVRRHGRVYELGMLTAYKLRSGDLMSDVGKFPQMLAKGKISLLPHSSGSAAEVRQVFNRADEEERRP